MKINNIFHVLFVRNRGYSRLTIRCPHAQRFKLALPPCDAPCCEREGELGLKKFISI